MKKNRRIIKNKMWRLIGILASKNSQFLIILIPWVAKKSRRMRVWGMDWIHGWSNLESSN